MLCRAGCGESQATGCRAGNRLEVHGANFKFLVSVSFGSPGGARYLCTSFYANSGDVAMCFVPDVSPNDAGTPLTLRVTTAVNGALNATLDSNDFDSAYLWGALTIASAKGCQGAGSDGIPTGCRVGDALTLTGSGFGDASTLSSSMSIIEVQSNTQMTVKLPMPGYSFNVSLYLQAGVSPPLATAYTSVRYAPFPLIFAIGGPFNSPPSPPFPPLPSPPLLSSSPSCRALLSPPPSSLADWH